ncbi:hypothetical protein [Streptomyces globisporus]|uniref:hypothetical protein n=1 Tax=Streptomyces globisporus TaxID=1908 RepID=UPI002092B271|nr:hypothetical protein [Streptomyces sp. HB202]
MADVGWTVTDVGGWLHLRGEVTRVRRGSGLLAVLLNNAENVLDTPAKRTEAVDSNAPRPSKASKHVQSTTQRPLTLRTRRSRVLCPTRALCRSGPLEHDGPGLRVVGQIEASVSMSWRWPTVEGAHLVTGMGSRTGTAPGATDRQIQLLDVAGEDVLGEGELWNRLVSDGQEDDLGQVAGVA